MTGLAPERESADTDTERSNMSIKVVAPPNARPTRPRTLRKGWAQEMLARCVSKPYVVDPMVDPMRAPAMGRRPASGRQPDIAISASAHSGRRAMRLTLPKARAD
jgi:hypothetical protein